MSEYRELLIGCGHSRDKRIPSLDGNPSWRGLVTLDYNPDCKPDIRADLSGSPWIVRNPGALSIYPLLIKSGGDHLIMDDAFDEIHAYEILEHLGRQGDVHQFFWNFGEIWRVLKPGGHLMATCPSRYSPWLWGDPGHTRVICRESLVFLDREEYHKQLDGTRVTSMSDYRGVWGGDFICRKWHDNRETFLFILEAVKPARTWTT